MRRAKLFVISAIVLFGLVQTARVPIRVIVAQTPTVASIVASRDNTLYFHPQGLRSNGLGEHLFVGHTNHGHERRTLLAFDVAAQLPDGAEVVSATLQLTLSRTHAGPQSISVHHLVADWGEGTSNATENVGRGTDAEPGDATWLQPFFGRDRLWKSPGGDFAADAIAQTVVSGPGKYSWGPSAGLTADAQRWVDHPDENFGWLLLGNEGEPRTTKRFDSKDSADTEAQPVLIIGYAPPLVDEFVMFLPLALNGERS